MTNRSRNDATKELKKLVEETKEYFISAPQQHIVEYALKEAYQQGRKDVCDVCTHLARVSDKHSGEGSK